jgi:DeoR/GlpR family transcriptional regulator of sugar metabolism
VTAPERRSAIRAILHVRDSIRVSELSERLHVSEVTIRKDLAVLEEQGYLLRTHGGVVPAENYDPRYAIEARRSVSVEEKRAIARAAAEILQHGETVFLDSGSTCAALATEIAEMELRVVTNSLDVLTILADRTSIALVALGGSYRTNAGSFVGPWTNRNLENVLVDHAFLGATGITRDGRFSSQNNIESEVKRGAIAAARTSVVLADRRKIGVQAFSVFAGPDEIDVLVSDVTQDERDAFESLGIHVIATKG